MAVLHHSAREINCKIVYYGPGLGGKTTNLQYIHQQLSPASRGDLISLKTKSDRTLFFDFLPVDLGEIAGWKIKFSVYTVPGQVEYNSTRKLVLNSADAIVFVADSDPNRSFENAESLQNMYENTRELGLNIDKIAWILQYNKRDLTTAMPLERMEKELNTAGVPSYQAVAKDGLGVIAALRAISKLMLDKLSQEIKK